MHMLADAPAEAPALQAWSGCWDLTRGMHPHLAGLLSGLAEVPPLPGKPEIMAEVVGLGLPLQPVTHGHHVVRDSGFIAAAMPSGGMASGLDEYPLAPVFVRDLCGRIIHTGLLPLQAPPTVPVFPGGCAVAGGMPGAEWIENAVFTTYRRLECAPARGQRLAGQIELELQALYPQPSGYPYKLRPDTFYADGWRVPQVARVFARAVPPVEAQQAADELAQRWQTRPQDQGYEAFYDANNGDDWFAELFEKGCTVIPTVEAYNGRYHVGDDYAALEVDPGRAVPGLHMVVEERDSPLPPGTILEVMEPGWVTATTQHPAQVAVSNGSGFVMPDMPEPLLPDLTLPHPRVSSKWGAVWLPTHPQHFAEPALWDWDESGHFVQVSGPLWDPVHYVYTSTPLLARAQRKPLAEAPHLFELNEKLRATFHPLAEMTWYDAFNERTLQQRCENAAHPLFGSAIDQVPLGVKVATAGYHPLPLGLEYELDPAHFPGRHPRHRVQSCPAELQGRLVPLASLVRPREEYTSHNVVLTEPFRAALAGAEAAPRRDDFAILLAPQSVAAEVVLPSWLPDVPASQLFINVKRLFANRGYRQALQAAASTVGVAQLPAALYQFCEAALAWRRLRYRLFVKYPEIWQKAWLEGIDIRAAEAMVSTQGEEAPEGIRTRRSALLSVKSVPVSAAGGLPLGATPAKLHANRRKPTTAGKKTGR